MTHLSSFSTTAFLIADPTLALMLAYLLDGRAHPAGGRAHISGVTPATTSAHLSKLLEGGLVTVEIQGRHRYYRIATPEVAYALEQLATIHPLESLKKKALSPQGRQLQFCRRCYDHLAGKVGVSVTQSLQDHGFLSLIENKQYEVTPIGKDWFSHIGINISAIKRTKIGLARQCLDWTERRHHLAGPLGTQFMSHLCALDWVRSSSASRAVIITPKGWLHLKAELGLDEQTINNPI